jgi:hypothetical protein
MKQLLFFWLLLPAMLCAQGNYTSPPKTGDPVLDDANHTKAKTEWIKNNPESYRAMGGNPNEVLKANQPEPVKEQRTLPAFAAQKTYALVDVRAIAAEGWQVSENELAKETQLMQQKYQNGRLLLAENNQIAWQPNPEADLRGQEIAKTGNAVEWRLERPNCETCKAKILYLNLITNQNNTRIYNLQSDDAGSKFAYQFTYQLIP